METESRAEVISRRVGMTVFLGAMATSILVGIIAVLAFTCKGAYHAMFNLVG